MGRRLQGLLVTRRCFFPDPVFLGAACLARGVVGVAAAATADDDDDDDDDDDGDGGHETNEIPSRTERTRLHLTLFSVSPESYIMHKVNPSGEPVAALSPLSLAAPRPFFGDIFAAGAVDTAAPIPSVPASPAAASGCPAG